MVSFNRFMERPNDVTNKDLENLYRFGSVQFGKKTPLTPEQKTIVRGALIVRWNNGTNVVSIGDARKGRGTCRDTSYKTSDKSDFTALDKAIKELNK